MRYRLLLLLAVFSAVAACDAQRGIVAPDNSPERVDPNHACSNALIPPAGFRVTYSHDGVSHDTSARYVNRFLVPHRQSDTVVTKGNQGQPLLFIFAYRSPADCITLFDSLLHHAPNVNGAFSDP
jgi:hypothetical protein